MLFHAFVLAEAAASSLHSCGLDGEDKVIIVLAIEVWHETLLAGEALIDKEVLFIVAHRVAEIHINHLPTMPLEFVADHPVEILVINGIVGAEGGGVVVEYIVVLDGVNQLLIHLVLIVQERLTMWRKRRTMPTLSDSGCRR